MSKNLLHHLESIEFYIPKRNLVLKICKTIAAARNKDHQKLLAEMDPEQTEIMTEEISEFLLDLGVDMKSPSVIDNDKSDLDTMEKLISDQIYHGLAFCARENKGGKSFHIKSTISSELSKSLGLSVDHHLLLKIGEDFASWLKKQGEFKPDWGKILYLKNNEMSLEAFEIKPNKRIKPSVDEVPNLIKKVAESKKAVSAKAGSQTSYKSRPSRRGTARLRASMAFKTSRSSS